VGQPAKTPPSASAWLAYKRGQIAVFPNRFRLMCAAGVLLISVFYLTDVTYTWPAYVDLSPREFLIIRLIWVACYIALFATSFFRETLPWLQTVRELLILTVTAGFLGVVSAHTGRMGSPYYGGVILGLLARTVLLPGVLRRMAASCAFVILLWAGVACLWPARLPPPGLSGETGRAALLNLTFILSALAFVLIATHLADRLALGLETAKLMGRYRLGRRLASGGMGDVYLAYHASLRRPCAVKILKEELTDPHAVARFELEAEAASRLRHPNTIAVFDFGRTDNGQPYYVMEYLEGCDLRDLVNRDGPLPPERAQYLLVQAARSLAEAHAQNMVHRDIKPGNLFVATVGGQADFIKVLDFGLVKLAEGPDLTRANAFMGTPRYMAPEALNGKQVDARADVYALGTVGYFMLCGQPPFYSSDPYADIRRQLNEAPPPIAVLRPAGLPEPSPELEAVLARCLERDPAARFADAAELVAALERTPEHQRWSPPSLSSSSPSLSGGRPAAGPCAPRPPGDEKEGEEDTEGGDDATEDERAPTLPAGVRLR
jgi:serine/threonine protein kinase